MRVSVSILTPQWFLLQDPQLITELIYRVTIHLKRLKQTCICQWARNNR